MLRLTFILFVAGLTVLASCNKDDDDIASDGSKFYITFKADGQQYEYRSTADQFNLEIICTHNVPNATMTLYSTSVSGRQHYDVHLKNEMTLAVHMPVPLQTGITYTSGSTSAAGQIQAEIFLLSWFDAQGHIYQCSFSHDVFGHASNGRFTITEINAEGLKGTFSGTFYNNDFTQSFSVSEGKFYAWEIK